MKHNNIIVLIDVYNEHGGASMAAVEAGRYYRHFFSNVYIVCNNKIPGEDLPHDVIILDNEKSIRLFLAARNITCIHYFQTESSIKHRRVFSKFVDALGKDIHKIRVLTTVCQQPSSPVSILTPVVIKYSDFIVFIDKTAFSDPNYCFIPEDRKTWFYLSSTMKQSPFDQFVKVDYGENRDYVVFGRGCTFNKYPKDTIEIYDKIRIIKNKKFYAIGVNQGNNWFSKIATKREDIKHCPILPIEKYAEECSKMDVFVYYLPKDSYSSIDGSLGIVMRLGVPVIVYGPLAPKERIVHGENGYIAETKNDIIKYAEMLGNSATLREKIGKAGRQSILDRIPTIDWKDRHIELINKLLEEEKPQYILVPFTTIISIFFKRYFYNIKKLISKILNLLFK